MRQSGKASLRGGVRKPFLSFPSLKKRHDGDEEQIGHKKAKPRNAQAKPIESWFFHALENPLMQKNLPGYSRQDKKDEKRNEFIQATLRE